MADADYTDLRGSRRPRKFTLTGKLFPGEPHLHADARWVVQVIDTETGETKCIDLAKLHAWNGRVAQAVPDALAAMTAERDAERGRADRAVREWDEAVAAARRDALEEAARIADEFAAENLRMAMDSIHLDPALASADFSPEAQKMTERMQAHGAHHAGSSAGCEQVAAAIRAAALAARTGGRADG